MVYIDMYSIPCCDLIPSPEGSAAYSLYSFLSAGTHFACTWLVLRLLYVPKSVSVWVCVCLQLSCALKLRQYVTSHATVAMSTVEATGSMQAWFLYCLDGEKVVVTFILEVLEVCHKIVELALLLEA